jgi:hypothetical protein
MSVPAMTSRTLAHRLLELQRELDAHPTPQLWDEYYRAGDLWERMQGHIKRPKPEEPRIPGTAMGPRVGAKR